MKAQRRLAGIFPGFSAIGKHRCDGAAVFISDQKHILLKFADRVTAGRETFLTHGEVEWNAEADWVLRLHTKRPECCDQAEQRQNADHRFIHWETPFQIARFIYWLGAHLLSRIS